MQVEMLHKILCVLFLLQTRTKDCECDGSDSKVTGVLDYVPSSNSLEQFNKSMKENVASFLTIRPLIVMIQMLETIRKGEKFKDGTVGKVDDAKEGVEKVGKKLFG